MNGTSRLYMQESELLGMVMNVPKDEVSKDISRLKVHRFRFDDALMLDDMPKTWEETIGLEGLLWCCQCGHDWLSFRRQLDPLDT